MEGMDKRMRRRAVVLRGRKVDGLGWIWCGRFHRQVWEPSVILGVFFHTSSCER